MAGVSRSVVCRQCQTVPSPAAIQLVALTVAGRGETSEIPFGQLDAADQIDLVHVVWLDAARLGDLLYLLHVHDDTP
jgi:hypothetical protein